MPLANLYSGRRERCRPILSLPPPLLGAGLAKRVHEGSLPLSDFKGGVLGEGIPMGAFPSLELQRL